MPAESRKARPTDGETGPGRVTATTHRVRDSRVSGADLAMRCAWLREHARHLFSVDPSGQLSVQLMDFADLLEVAQARGWFE